MYLVAVVELQKGSVQSAPPGLTLDSEQLMGSMTVVSLRAPRAQTAPNAVVKHGMYSSTLSLLYPMCNLDVIIIHVLM